MAGIEIPDGYGNLTGIWVQANQTRANSSSIGFKLTAGHPTVSDGEDACEAMADLLCNESTDATRLIRVNLTYNIGGTIYTGGQDFNRLGSIVQAGITPNTAVLVQKRTGLVGRQHRGRMYLPPPAEGAVSAAGLIDEAQHTDYQNLVNGFVTDWIGIGSFDYLYLLHAEGSTTPPTVLQAQPGGLVVSQYVATQRRRMRRGAL